MQNKPTQQWELRADLYTIISDYLDEIGITEIADVISDEGDFPVDKGIVRAIYEYQEQLTKTMKMLSRIAVRLGHLDKESK